MADYFDDICASKESQLYAKQCTVEDNEQVKRCRKAILDSPEDGELYITLGDALSYQLRYIEAIAVYAKAIINKPKCAIGYQKRGGRYLTTLQLTRALEDFKVCLSFGQNAEIEILSGLAAYMLKQYGNAKKHFRNWIAIAGDDTEELVSTIYWYILCCVKDSDADGIKDILKLYTPGMYFGHHTAYKCGIDLFQGDISTEEAMLTAQAADGDDQDLEYSIILYAAANYELWSGNTNGYLKLLDAILLRDTFWAGFASLAALNDRYPNVAQRSEEHTSELQSQPWK